VDRLNLADAFVTLFALLGPQKVLLPVARMARARPVPDVRLAVLYASAAAASVGMTCALAAPWLATFFHITTASVQLASGVVFFGYAICLVFGIHIGEDQGGRDLDDDPGAEPGPSGDHAHPVSTGFRELLLPFIVSPLGVAAALEGSLTASDWGDRGIVAGAYVAVVAADLAAAAIVAPLMRRAHPTSLEVLSRLLGILLSAVGVNLFLDGLSALGVHIATGH
jgi:multiple antibiotic resistance protein